MGDNRESSARFIFLRIVSNICALLCAAMISFFECSPKEANETVAFINENRTVIRNTLSDLSATEQLMAVSIVAPEISQFSSFLNYLELRTLFVMYLNTGKSDFSVGYFQMKPGFVENLEKKVASSESLSKRFKDVIPSGSEREKREFRLKRLASLTGQLRYLELFIVVARTKTSHLKFGDNSAKLKYWATLYNSGVDLNESDVYRLQKLNLFPKFEKKYNYAAVSNEFFNELKKHGW